MSDEQVWSVLHRCANTYTNVVCSSNVISQTEATFKLVYLSYLTTTFSESIILYEAWSFKKFKYRIATSVNNIIAELTQL